MLDVPVLSCLVIDDAVTLRFGRTDVVIGDPFELEVDGVGHHLDPHRHDTLGPLLATYPGTAQWLWASPDGTLHLVFMQGQRLVVPGPAVRSAWSVGRSDAPADAPPVPDDDHDEPFESGG